MSYSEKSIQIACDASIAVLALSNSEGTDLEFLPLKPQSMSQSYAAELRARWPGRNLRTVGVIGLVGASARVALKEPMEHPEQISALAEAFLAYVTALLGGNLAEALVCGIDDSVSWCERLYALPDPRHPHSEA